MADRLPQIDYSARVQDSTGAKLRESEAERRAFKTVEAGMAAFSEARTTAQRNKADAALAQSLSEITADLDSRETVDTEYVRKKLGSLDSLPPELRAEVTERALNINTGETQEIDKKDIPTYLVAGAVFDAQSRAAVEAAAQNVSSAGWAQDFKTQAAKTLLAHKMKIRERALNQGLDYIKESDTKSALELANAGQPERARELVGKSRGMAPAYKVKLSEQIDKIEQVRPVYEALQRNDYGSMAEFIGKLNDPKEFTSLEPQERAAFSDRLKAEVKNFQEAAKKEKDDSLQRNAAEFVDPTTGRRMGWNPIFEKIRAKAPVSYADIPPPGTIKPDEQKQMIDYVDNARKGVEPKTDLKLYASLSDLARNEPEKFAALPLTSLVNRLSPTDFKHFVDLQTKPPGAAAFDDFLTTDEAINSKLSSPEVGFDLKAAKDDPENAEKVGHVKSLIQHELAALGHRASVTERDDIIDRVVKSEITVKRHWYKGDERKVATLGVPPKYVVALRRVASDLGFGLSAEGLAETYKDFAFYEDGITQAWGPLAGPKKRLTPDLALGVYGYLKARWGDIDAELRRAGKLTGKNEIDNTNRTALAVQGFLHER